MKINEFRLRKELAALDMMIAALSSDLARRDRRGESGKVRGQLFTQMNEALVELRCRRGQTRFLLTALEKNRRRSRA